MSQHWVLTEDEAVELLAFLVASARTQLDEPCRYASMRLLSAAEIVRDRIRARASENLTATLRETDSVTAQAQAAVNDTEAYRSLLDELCETIGRYIVIADLGSTEPA